MGAGGADFVRAAEWRRIREFAAGIPGHEAPALLAVSGEAGAGKSTLLHLLGMHDSAWTGEYYLGEHAIHKLAKKDRMELYKKFFGFVFQSYHLLDSLTVYENLDIPLSYRNIKKSERDSIVCDVLDRFQIVGKKDLYPNQLSGGQQQLVAIARAIVASTG